MYPRRPHTKSRNGCGQCKRAHIKVRIPGLSLCTAYPPSLVQCDLQAPLCSQCAKKKRTCDYQLRFSTHGSVNPRTPSAIVQIPALGHQVPRLPVSPITLLSLFDYEVPIWESGFGKVYDQHFVRHGILAISALYHDAYRQDSHSPISKTALFHQLEALRLFRHTITAVTEDNWPSLLIFAVAIVMFHFSITSKAPEGCIQTMLLLRNSTPLGPEIGGWLKKSGLKALLSAKKPEHRTPPDLDSVKAPMEALEALESCVICSDNTGVASLAYQQAISALKKWLSWTEGQPLAWIHFVWWPASITLEYMALLAENEDGALLIFVHWCDIMKNAPPRWYLHGWGETVGASTFHCIRSRDWHLLLKWAMNILEIELSWMAAGVLLDSIKGPYVDG